MDSVNILGQLRKLSRRTYTFNHSCFRLRDLVLYEQMYSLLKGKNKPVNLFKACSQYFVQSILGIYRTDYGVVKSDYFVEGSDLLVGLVASLQLLRSGGTVIFYGYNLSDYSLPTKIYSENRYSTIPLESIRLLCGDLGIDFKDDLQFEDICNQISNKIEDEYPDKFIFLKNVNMSDFYEVSNGCVCSLVKSQKVDNTFFIPANELILLESLISGENSNKNRRRGRVISMIKSNKVISISQKTKDTPRVNEAYEIRIADGDRQTQSADALYVKDRNKDIIEALAINEKIRYSNGVGG